MLYIVRGLPGSGKTTFAKELLLTPREGVKISHYEADMYFGHEYKFDPDKLKNAHDWCYNNTRRALMDGEDVVVANTFTTEREMKRYLELSEELDVDVIVYDMRYEYLSIHNVPEEVINRMRNRYKEIADMSEYARNRITELHIIGEESE